MRKLRYKNLNMKDESGVVVVLTVLLIGIMLSIVFTLSSIFLTKMKSAGDIKRSVVAVYAAETAIEWCLFVNRIGPVDRPIMSNGASYVNGNTNNPFPAVPPTPGECVSPVRATGIYQGVTRSFEISF